eukprot:4209236-Amphidinium_carterae.2
MYLCVAAAILKCAAMRGRGRDVLQCVQPVTAPAQRADHGYGSRWQEHRALGRRARPKCVDVAQ